MGGGSMFFIATCLLSTFGGKQQHVLSINNLFILHKKCRDPIKKTVKHSIVVAWKYFLRGITGPQCMLSKKLCRLVLKAIGLSDKMIYDECRVLSGKLSHSPCSQAGFNRIWWKDKLYNLKIKHSDSLIKHSKKSTQQHLWHLDVCPI